MQHSRTASFGVYSTSPGQQSSASSQRRTLGSGDGDSQSIRDRELEESQDRHDRWATRASSGTERAERELGLGDDVNMGLS
jgi:hypothetical protein